jgi:four helix bundle protein
MGQSFRDLVVWQRAIELTLAVYKVTSEFPDSERFGLTNQMRRAAVSVASNIAEGYGRSTKGEYVLFLGHARGSCSEIETQIVIAKELAFGAPRDLEFAESLCNDVGRLLGDLMKSLRQKQPPVPQSLVPLIPGVQ